ncbi:MAG: hypothetical protein KUG61_02515 [Parvibaculaceae bacterium]|nr:hypothetical protein [Parvibaculaceae bacterium]
MQCNYISCRLSLFILALLVSFEAQAAPFCFTVPHVGTYGQLAPESDFGILLPAGSAVQSVRLLHLRLPINDGEKAHAYQVVSAALARKKIDVFGQVKKLDRYQRLPGHLVAQQVWLQKKWVLNGLFRVLPGMMLDKDPARERELACLGELFRAEFEAIEERRGLWSASANSVLASEDLIKLQKHIAQFVLVEGTVRAVGKGGGRHFINFGDDWRSDFTVVVPQSVLNRWPKGFKHSQFLQGRSLSSLVGQVVRVRGWLTSYNGPEVLLDDLSQIEILGSGKLPFKGMAADLP